MRVVLVYNHSSVKKGEKSTEKEIDKTVDTVLEIGSALDKNMEILVIENAEFTLMVLD